MYMPHVVGATALLMLSAWLMLRAKPQESLPSADAVLARAILLNQSHLPRTMPGVIVQQVRIDTSEGHFSRTLYRDPQGRRRPRIDLTSKTEDEAARQLHAAGVEAQDPLSVRSFTTWRNQLQAPSDRVVRGPSGLTTVTTADAATTLSIVRSESLTIRDIDGHPVSRDIQFRDSGEIEIAELDYHVVGWERADPNWFEDSNSVPLRLPKTSLRKAESTPSPAAALSDAQLDLAEIHARLILSREEADAKDQIDLLRTTTGISVHGLVESPERRERLSSELVVIPNVRTDLYTADEAAKRLAEPSLRAGTPVTMIEGSSHEAPLLIYWKKLQRHADDYAALSTSMFNAGLEIRRQARALDSLLTEFAPKMPLESEAALEFDSLWQDHEDKLLKALATEERVLKDLTPAIAQPETSSQDKDDDKATVSDAAARLDNSAARIMILCRELTSGTSNGTTDAASILASLDHELQSGAAAAKQLRRTPFGAADATKSVKVR